MRILIVDDDFTSRKILLKCANKFGVCDMAANGKEALSAYQLALAESEPYDLILLDIQMPEMDGREVLRVIRTLENPVVNETHGHTRIIMATSLADKENVISSFREQCDGYILKPYSPESVRRDLQHSGVLE